MTTKLPNSHKIYQIAVIYSKWPYATYTNIFHFKAFQNWPKLGFLVCKYTIWQPWLSDAFNSRLTAQLGQNFLSNFRQQHAAVLRSFAEIQITDRQNVDSKIVDIPIKTLHTINLPYAKLTWHNLTKPDSCWLSTNPCRAVRWGQMKSTLSVNVSTYWRSAVWMLT
jgi:hypothetical protein